MIDSPIEQVDSSPMRGCREGRTLTSRHDRNCPTRSRTQINVTHYGFGQRWTVLHVHPRSESRILSQLHIKKSCDDVQSSSLSGSVDSLIQRAFVSSVISYHPLIPPTDRSRKRAPSTAIGMSGYRSCLSETDADAG
jgi:hypothetical protein